MSCPPSRPECLILSICKAEFAAHFTCKFTWLFPYVDVIRAAPRMLASPSIYPEWYIQGEITLASTLNPDIVFVVIICAIHNPTQVFIVAASRNALPEILLLCFFIDTLTRALNPATKLECCNAGEEDTHVRPELVRLCRCALLNKGTINLANQSFVCIKSHFVPFVKLS